MKPPDQMTSQQNINMAEAGASLRSEFWNVFVINVKRTCSDALVDCK